MAAASQVGQIAQLLDATLDRSQHRKAEAALKQEAQKQNYSLNLLSIVQSTSLPPKTRLAAALAFKNFIRTSYVNEDGEYKLPLDEVKVIKEQLIGLMISCPPSIQTQLGESISIIADSDFWTRWETLTQDLVSRFSTTDPKVNIGVLEVAHSIFARWRPLYRTDELYTEINHVITTFGQPFLKLLQTTDAQITNNANNKAALTGWFETLSLLVKIFHDMSCHDMPPIFEENLESISGLLLKYFGYTNPVLATDDDSEVSIVDTVKADICEALQLYTIKYNEEFGRFCENFITSAWNLLSTTGPETKYDMIVSKALHFLTAVAGTSEHSHVFNSEDVLTQIVEKVILPNVALRESDEEQFEDEPIEFIRRDLEGSDADTRRRAATDFLRSLQEKFETPVTTVVSKYIGHYLEQGKTNWKAKDTAIYLFISIASKGKVTAAQGVKTVNPLVNVVDFFGEHIAQDLLQPEKIKEGDAGVEPMSKVDAIKYLYTFRSQLSREQWKSAINPLIQNLNSPNYVVYTYAAVAVERVLFLTDDGGQPMFPRSEIEPYAKDLLDHLFKLIEREVSNPAKLQENEYLMRCVMRILIVVKDGAVPIAEGLLEHLINITNAMKQNPSNPRFYYYHFETLGALVRYCSASKAAVFNQRLWEPILQIILEDVTEFVPYGLQVLALLLEVSPPNTVSANFGPLLTSLLSPAIWESRGNVPACVRLLSASIPLAAGPIVAENKLEQILGIFERLIQSNKLNLYAFDVLDSIVKGFQPAQIEQYFGTILRFIFAKLQSGVGETFKLRFVRFYHLVSSKLEAGYGADYFFQESEKVQQGLFQQIYPAFILSETSKLARPVDRKLAVVSFTKTLCDSKVFGEKFQKGWANTCRIMMDLLVNPPTVASGLGDEVIAEADVDDIGFGLTFTALNTCKPVVTDDFADIQDVVAWVRGYMQSANQRHGGAIASFITSRLPPDQRDAVVKYLQ
jgi:exportin-2 (importin alpha re-exporter)